MFNLIKVAVKLLHCYAIWQPKIGNWKWKNGVEIPKWTALLQYYMTYVEVKTAKANEKQGSHSRILYTTGYRIENYGYKH